MTAITISRQMGSLGCQVALAVGECLEYRVVWREVINQAAQRAGAPELALHAIDDLGLLGVRPSLQEQRAYRAALSQVMNELAEEGRVVIVGRAGQAILRGNADVFHVRVVAPEAVRIGRVAAAQGISQEAAQAQVTASDRARRSFLRRGYQLDWDTPDLYDLIINTARFSPMAAAHSICEAMSHGSPTLYTPPTMESGID